MISADLRVLAATNRDLEVAVSTGRFREDLFHRLNIVHLKLPPLRERRDDIPLLLQHFMTRFCAENGRIELRMGIGVVEVLTSYDWPGNVREVVNCARYVSSLALGPVVTLSDLPPRIRDALPEAGILPVAPPIARASAAGSADAVPTGAPVGIRYDLPYKRAKRLWLEVFEFAYISALLRDHGGNISHAARAAGIDRKSIQRLMKRNQMTNTAGLESSED